MGYIGPVVTRHLRARFPDAILTGLDIGYFSNCLTTNTRLPESRLDAQYFSDIRSFSDEVLDGVDVVIHLAGISNDPIGNRFEEVTLEINHRASIALAAAAKTHGVKSFVFASSCSMYGAAEDSARKETSPLNPLTAYARSKVYTEQDLEKLADPTFSVTCLRFSTACGMSDRLRLDLVLNDFVAAAVTSGRILILSDGTPWRPLIHVKDMARAIEWAIGRQESSGDAFLAVNVGSNGWNHQVKDLAEAVAAIIPGTDIEINQDALPDKRSYRVNFDLFEELAPHHQPEYDLHSTIIELKAGLEAMGFADSDFHDSNLIRLKTLKELRSGGFLDENLYWSSN